MNFKEFFVKSLITRSKLRDKELLKLREELHTAKKCYICAQLPCTDNLTRQMYGVSSAKCSLCEQPICNRIGCIVYNYYSGIYYCTNCVKFGCHICGFSGDRIYDHVCEKCGKNVCNEHYSEYTHLCADCLHKLP